MDARGLSDEFSIENVASFMDATLPYSAIERGFLIGSRFLCQLSVT